MTDNFTYDIVARAIDHLAAHGPEAANLDRLAELFGYEPTHFQKMFTEKAGISPKRLSQYMAFTRARDFLLDGHATLDAAYQAGLSGTGRLHELFVNCEAATPGAVKNRGAGMTITHAFHPTPIGDVLIAQTDRGVCWLGFVVDGGADAARQKMRRHWPSATFIHDADATADAAARVLSIWRGEGERGRKLTLHLHGTNFQIQVWQALLKIPSGTAVTYRHVAEAVGDIRACRAVGTAIGANPLALLIPCHRVIQSSGIVENYAWGTPRKKILLAFEARDKLEKAAKE